VVVACIGAAALGVLVQMVATQEPTDGWRKTNAAVAQPTTVTEMRGSNATDTGAAASGDVSTARGRN
jgi:hypothetical protein